MRSAWFVWAWLGVVGCAGSAQQAPPTDRKPSLRAEQSIELTERGDFGDAALPTEVMWLRVVAPARDLPVVGSLIGMSGLVDSTRLLEQQLGESLASTVDASRPIDALLSEFGDAPKLLMAYSVGDPTAFAAKLSPELTLSRVGPGRWRLVETMLPRKGGEHGCELWYGARAVGARLLCGDAKQIEQRGAVLMAPQRAAHDSASVHLEMPHGVLNEAVVRSAKERDELRKLPAPSEESRGEDFGRALVNDLIGELDGLALSLKLNEGSIDLAQELRFRKVESLGSLLIAGRSGTPLAVPDGFWHLPSDSSFALYSEGGEEAALRRAATVLAKQLLTDIRSDEELPASELARHQESLASLVLRGGAWEIAYGDDFKKDAEALDEAARKLVPSGARSGSADPALKAAQAKLGRWLLVGLQDDHKTYLESIRQVVAISRENKQYPKRVPTDPKAKPVPPSPTRLTLALVPAKAVAKLPASTLHVLASIEPNPKYATPRDGREPAPAPLAYHVFAAPGVGQQVWLSVARDEATALLRLQGVLASESSDTLATNGELQQLAKGQVAGLGYATLAAFVAFHIGADSASDVAESRANLSKLWTLPKKGAAKMPVWITRSAGAGSARTVTYNARLKPDALADLVQLVIQGIAESEAPDESTSPSRKR